MATTELTENDLCKWTIIYDDAHRTKAHVKACYVDLFDADTASFLMFKDHTRQPVYFANVALVFSISRETPA